MESSSSWSSLSILRSPIMGAPTRNSFGTDGVIGDMAKPARVEQTWGQVSAQVVLVRLVASVVVTVRRSHGNEEKRDPQHILPPRPIAVAAASSKRRGASEIVPSRARAPHQPPHGRRVHVRAVLPAAAPRALA